MAAADLIMHQVGQAMWSNGSIKDICDIANFRRVKGFSFSQSSQNSITATLRDAAMRILSVTSLDGTPIQKVIISKENILYCDRVYPLEVNLLNILDDGMMDQAITDIADYIWFTSSKPDSMLMIQYTCTPDLDVSIIRDSAPFDYMARMMFKSINVRGSDGMSACMYLDKYDAEAYQTQMTRVGLSGHLACMFNTQAYFGMSSEIFRKYCNGVRMDIVRDDGDMIFTVVDDIIPANEPGIVMARRTLMSNGELVSQSNIYYGRVLKPDQREVSTAQNLELFRTLTASIMPDQNITCRFLFRPSTEGQAILDDKHNIVQNALSYVSMDDRSLMAIGELPASYPLRAIYKLHEEAQSAFVENGDPWVSKIATDLKDMWDAYWLVTHCSDKAQVSSCVASRTMYRLAMGARFLSTIYGITVSLDEIDFDS